jgi:RNA polymerase sigma-70 factor (ECF subfamily)
MPAPLTEPLDTALELARAAWPALEVPPEEFARYLEARLDPEADVLARLHVADLYLACACVRGQPAAIAAFVERHLGDVPAQLGRLRLRPDLAGWSPPGGV